MNEIDFFDLIFTVGNSWKMLDLHLLLYAHDFYHASYLGTQYEINYYFNLFHFRNSQFFFEINDYNYWMHMYLNKNKNLNYIYILNEYTSIYNFSLKYIAPSHINSYWFEIRNLMGNLIKVQHVYYTSPLMEGYIHFQKHNIIYDDIYIHILNLFNLWFINFFEWPLFFNENYNFLWFLIKKNIITEWVYFFLWLIIFFNFFGIFIPIYFILYNFLCKIYMWTFKGFLHWHFLSFIFERRKRLIIIYQKFSQIYDVKEPHFQKSKLYQYFNRLYFESTVNICTILVFRLFYFILVFIFYYPFLVLNKFLINFWINIKVYNLTFFLLNYVKLYAIKSNLFLRYAWKTINSIKNIYLSWLFMESHFGIIRGFSIIYHKLPYYLNIDTYANYPLEETNFIWSIYKKLFVNNFFLSKEKNLKIMKSFTCNFLFYLFFIFSNKIVRILLILFHWFSKNSIYVSNSISLMLLNLYIIILSNFITLAYNVLSFSIILLLVLKIEVFKYLVLCVTSTLFVFNILYNIIFAIVMKLDIGCFYIGFIVYHILNLIKQSILNLIYFSLFIIFRFNLIILIIIGIILGFDFQTIIYLLYKLSIELIESLMYSSLDNYEYYYYIHIWKWAYNSLSENVMFAGQVIHNYESKIFKLEQFFTKHLHRVLNLDSIMDLIKNRRKEPVFIRYYVVLPRNIKLYIKYKIWLFVWKGPLVVFYNYTFKNFWPFYIIIKLSSYLDTYLYLYLYSIWIYLVPNYIYVYMNSFFIFYFYIKYFIFIKLHVYKLFWVYILLYKLLIYIQYEIFIIYCNLIKMNLLDKFVYFYTFIFSYAKILVLQLFKFSIRFSDSIINDFFMQNTNTYTLKVKHIPFKRLVNNISLLFLKWWYNSLICLDYFYSKYNIKIDYWKKMSNKFCFNVKKSGTERFYDWSLLAIDTSKYNVMYFILSEKALQFNILYLDDLNYKKIKYLIAFLPHLKKKLFFFFFLFYLFVTLLISNLFKFNKGIQKTYYNCEYLWYVFRLNKSQSNYDWLKSDLNLEVLDFFTNKLYNTEVEIPEEYLEMRDSVFQFKATKQYLNFMNKEKLKIKEQLSDVINHKTFKVKNIIKQNTKNVKKQTKIFYQLLKNLTTAQKKKFKFSNNDTLLYDFKSTISFDYKKLLYDKTYKSFYWTKINELSKLLIFLSYNSKFNEYIRTLLINEINVNVDKLDNDSDVSHIGIYIINNYIYNSLWNLNNIFLDKLPRWSFIKDPGTYFYVKKNKNNEYLVIDHESWIFDGGLLFFCVLPLLFFYFLYKSYGMEIIFTAVIYERDFIYFYLKLFTKSFYYLNYYSGINMSMFSKTKASSNAWLHPLPFYPKGTLKIILELNVFSSYIKIFNNYNVNNASLNGFTIILINGLLILKDFFICNFYLKNIKIIFYLKIIFVVLYGLRINKKHNSILKINLIKIKMVNIFVLVYKINKVKWNNYLKNLWY